MSGRRIKSRDANEAEIVRALEAAGYSVQRLDPGGGCPDLLVGGPDQRARDELARAMAQAADHWDADKLAHLEQLKHLNFLLEVKDPTAPMHGGAAYVHKHHFDAAGRYAGLHSRLRRSQCEWHKAWRGRKPVVVESVEEALAAVGAEVSE